MAQRATGFPASAALFAVAFTVRVLPWPTIFGENRVYLFGYDAYYHLRRILYTTLHFPKVLDFDPYVGFPTGAEVPWPPFFDGVLSLLILPFVELGNTAAIERITVWVPPLLGAATVVALHRLGLRWFDSKVAFAAALLLAVLPGHFWYSQIGFVDHHAAVSLVSTLLLGSAMWLLRCVAECSNGGHPILRAAFITGLLQSGLLLTWTGGLLHVGIVQVALFVFLLTRSRRSDALRSAATLAAVDVVALLGVLLGCERVFSSETLTFFPGHLSAFQPCLFGGGAALSGGLAVLWGATPAGRTHAMRISSFLAIVLLAIGMAAAMLPHVAGNLWEAWRIFTAQGRFMSGVAESRPLLATRGVFSFSEAHFMFSRLFDLVPLAFGAALWWARSQRSRASLILLLWWFAVLFISTLVQERFMNSFSPAFALLMAWACVTTGRWLYSRVGGSRTRRLAAGSLFALILVGILQPIFKTYDFHVVNQVAVLSGRSITVTPGTRNKQLVVRLARWMRKNTPATAGYFDASERPEYGILSPWNIGHVLRYEAQRPVVADNFRTNLRVVKRYFESDERGASKILEELQARYVVVSRVVIGETREGRPHSMGHRLYFEDGSEVSNAWSRHRLASIPALERHRLIYESKRLFEARQQTSPHLKVYEFVRGAFVTGRAAPGRMVHAALGLRSNQGRAFWYRSSALADDHGRYALRLPYASRGAPPAVQSQPHYTLTCLFDSAPLVIDEAEVQEGREVVGPDLCH